MGKTYPYPWRPLARDKTRLDNLPNPDDLAAEIVETIED